MRADYREIVGTLRDEIISGQYAPGSMLPPGPELAERFGGVSVSTINRALNDLRSEGLVRTRSGQGTTVNPVPVIHRDAAGRQRAAFRQAGRGAFDAEIRAAGLEPRSDAEIGEAAPPAAVSGTLGIPEGTAAVYRRRRMYAGPETVQLATSWIPAELAHGTPIMTADTGPGGLYSRLADTGHGPARFTETVLVRVPLDDEAAALGIDPDHRVYVITRAAYDSDGRAVEVCTHVMPTHQWELTYEWAAE
jgi:GntR family transcriptional regulator